ncbi:MAG: glycosyltransferase family 39 protein, partial [Acidobacteriota bacterium]
MHWESQPVEHSPRAQDLTILALAAGLLFFLGLGQRDLWNPNEPIYGRAVAEMEQGGEWLVPTVNDQVFAEKPILYFWSARVTAKLLGGVDELSLRVPAAVAGVASVVLTFLWVLPYVGRRRAFTTAALFATLYQVFWASRSVQMDIFVLASTLGVLVPLTRLLDFDLSPRRAWIYAGLAAGLGFTAKGPVTLILPGLVIAAYAVSTRRLGRLLGPPALWGGAIALVVSLPWYLALWLRGESAFLYEVLIRQNFMRFVDAWDHQQPWWYFLEYLWIDYAPWSWLLPAAALTVARSREEGRLQRQSWIWIAGIVFFFSLSESKRAPYILPIAPAVAALA